MRELAMNSKETRQIVLQALLEDTFDQDITTNLLVPKEKISEAYMIVKEDAVLCGLKIAKQVFHRIDKNLKFNTSFSDGDKVKKGTKIAFLKGKTRTILTGERTALNFLGYLSGIATNTNRFAEKVRHTKAKILDTRKTTPCLRKLEKYAVRCGGGVNHRHNLNEMVLIKDNHREISEHLDELVGILKKFRKISTKSVIIEVDTLAQLRRVLKAKPDIVLLDNMNNRQMRDAVKIVKAFKGKHPLLEASGGVTLKNVRSIAKTGVDRISTGALTHTYKTVDVSMEILTQ
ncbi:MAG: carboxylating nicotinate-nucleotide diphosphorylase [Candidatus Omnitrophica bacterium]|nr:carboxylating nicotinate-nucleotide diphosphorylase [Candidatus Omnitrophota bacterium]